MLGQIIAAVLGASSTILDKVVLSRHRVDVKQFIIAMFFILWLVTAITMPWLGGVDLVRAIAPLGIIYFLLLIFFAFVWNSIYYRVQKHETVQEFEIIVMMLPLFTATLAASLFPDERNWHVFGATIIAALALIISHLRRDHLTFNKYSWQLIVAIFFIALEEQMRKVLLGWFEPASLYFFRTGILAVLFILAWHPNKLTIPKKSWPHLIFSGISGAIMMILIFYGYRSLGIVLTTLILMLGPVLTYFLDFIILKEKLQPRIIVAAVVIMGCILYAGLMA